MRSILSLNTLVPAGMLDTGLEPRGALRLHIHIMFVQLTCLLGGTKEEQVCSAGAKVACTGWGMVGQWDQGSMVRQKHEWLVRRFVLARAS